MAEKTKIIVSSRSQRESAVAKEFTFSPDLARTSGAIGEFRKKAWRLFEEKSLPVITDEPWRRTDLRFLPVDAFRLPDASENLTFPEPPAELLAPLVGDKQGGQVILTPYDAKASLSEKLSQKGVIFTDLKTAEGEHPELVARLLGSVVAPEEGKFAALAAALAQTGVVLYVPKDVQVEEPLHSVYWGPGRNLAHIAHFLVLVEEGASVTYVHESASPDEIGGDSMVAANVELQVMSGASLRFVELQSWGKNVWNFSHERVRVERDGNLDWIFGAIGSRLTKNFSDLDLAGQGAHGRMSGFYFTEGNQHLDHDTQQNHLAPNTISDLLFKGALKGKSRSVWQGMIYVAPNAQKTDGYQANRNLVLDERARADSIPGLEISADDVRCSHGATVSKLEEEPLFYLKSRGIPQREAEKIMVEGFFDPIMQRIPFDGVRDRFQKYIQAKTATE